MELTPLLIYESFILSVGVAAVLAFALFYFRLLKGYHELSTQHKKIQEEVRTQHQKLLSETQDQAVEILAQSKALSSDVKAKLTKLLEDVARTEAKEYDQVMTQVEQTITQTSQQELREFTQELGQHAKDASEKLDAQMNAAYESAKEEVLGYKQKQIERIDAAIYDIISQVIVKNAGVLLTKEDHHAIVRTSLREVIDAHVL